MKFWPFKDKPFTVRFYMKSGNVIVQDGVTNFKYESTGSRLTSYNLDFENAAKKVFWMDVTQIEAVERTL